MQPDPTARRLAVVGGGIAGLAAAHRLIELAPKAKVVLYEAGERLGGVLRTARRDGYLLEHSADSFITQIPAALELCRRIGLEDQLLATDPRFRRALVVSRGRLYPVPEGFLLMAPARLWPVMLSPILSVRGRLRLACEPLVPRRRSTEDESLASFARRRLGREAFERLVQPLIGGIYTADPEKLSVAATMPQFVDMERRAGSLVRGMRRRARQAEESGARYGAFAAPRDGMESLAAAVASRLPPGVVRLRTAVTGIHRDGQRWRLTTTADPPRAANSGDAASASGQPNDDACFDGVVISTPTPAAARLLGPLDRTLGEVLSAIEHASSAIVLLGVRREQIAHPLDGFGFVVPRVERRRILSASFSSVKFPGRAPPGHVLIRVFFGGAGQEAIVELSDAELTRIACQELADLLGLTGQPVLVEVVRWRGAMPQYHVGHLERMEQVRQRLAELPGLQLAGNGYAGVGVPQCIRSGEEAAARLLAP